MVERLIVQGMVRVRATGQPILRPSVLRRLTLPQDAAPQARKLLEPTRLKRRGDVKAVRRRGKGTVIDEKKTRAGPAQGGPLVHLIGARQADSDSKGPLAPLIKARQADPDRKRRRRREGRGRPRKSSTTHSTTSGSRR